MQDKIVVMEVEMQERFIAFQKKNNSAQVINDFQSILG
jgi:hypothetical protein